MPSRKPEDLNIPTLTHYQLFRKAMGEAGIDFILDDVMGVHWLKGTSS